MDQEVLNDDGDDDSNSSELLEDDTLVSFESEADYILSLLNQWELDELRENFIKMKIDVNCLKFMTSEDINVLIPISNLGSRIKFRQKLYEWRELNDCAIPLAEAHQTVLKLPTPKVVPDSKPILLTSAFSTASLDLANILGANLDGKSLLANYKEQNCLNTYNRNKLCSIISEHWVETTKQVLQEDYKQAANEIVKIFPSEVQETYISRNSKTVGKLAQKYYAVSRKFQNRGYLKSRYTLKNKNLEIPADPAVLIPVVSGVSSDEQKEKSAGEKAWLQVNKTPEVTVFHKWQETYKERRQEILKGDVNIYVEWPLLKQQIGASLIELDFDKLHQGKDLLCGKFQAFIDTVVPFYKKTIKDLSSKQIFEKLGSLSDQNSIDYILIALLTSVILPSVIHNQNKKVWKPTILDAQNFFILRLEILNDLQDVVLRHRQLLKDKGLDNQPLIVVVGAVENLTGFYVHVDGIFYTCDNFRKALTVTFKCFQVLDIEYPKPIKGVWQFIQQHFYEIPIKGKKVTSLITLLDAVIKK